MISMIEFRHIRKKVLRTFVKIAIVFLVALVLFEIFGGILLHLSMKYIALLVMLAFFIACLEAVIYSQANKQTLTLCYVVKLFLMFCFVYVLHELYVPVANEPYVDKLKKVLDAIGNESKDFMSGILAQFACIIVFERVLHWMKAPVCPEWNPFYVGDLRIHKTASFVMTTAYFAYFSYGTLGYRTYLPIAEKIALLCVLVSIFWVQYPFENKSIPKAVTEYIKRSTNLYYTADELHREHDQIGRGAVYSSVWNQHICLPLFRRIYQLMTYKYSVIHFGKKYEVIRSLLYHLVTIYDSPISDASGRQNAKADSAKKAVKADSAKKAVKAKSSQNEQPPIKNSEAWVLAYIIGCGCAVSDGTSYLRWITAELLDALKETSDGHIIVAFKMGVVYGLQASLGREPKTIANQIGIPDIEMRAVPPEYKRYFDYLKNKADSNVKKPSDHYSKFIDSFYQELNDYNEQCNTVAEINQG